MSTVCFIFTPIWGRFHFDYYFSDGLKPPTRRALQDLDYEIQYAICLKRSYRTPICGFNWHLLHGGPRDPTDEGSQAADLWDDCKLSYSTISYHNEFWPGVSLIPQRFTVPLCDMPNNWLCPSYHEVATKHHHPAERLAAFNKIQVRNSGKLEMLIAVEGAWNAAKSLKWNPKTNWNVTECVLKKGGFFQKKHELWHPLPWVEKPSTSFHDNFGTSIIFPWGKLLNLGSQDVLFFTSWGNEQNLGWAGRILLKWGLAPTN